MQVQQNFLLKKYNTFAVDVYAKYFVEFDSVDMLQQTLQSLTNEPILILGGGSNILFTKNYEGLVLKNDLRGISIIKEDEDFVYVRAGAGENWHEFVLYCLQLNLGGIENLSLIPGNIGASPMQNIGAYGVELKDVFYELEALHLKDKTVSNFNSIDCEFGYRDSIFKRRCKDQFAILSVTFRLNKKPQYNTTYGAIEQELKQMDVRELSIRAVSQAVINLRRSKLPDPAVIGNAGSFFKNPTIPIQKLNELKRINLDAPSYKTNDDNFKIPAGWLIEQCGWKGYRRGDAGCHAKQALVLVNYGNASGEQIYKLSEEIRQSVKERFDILLETEVNVI